MEAIMEGVERLDLLPLTVMRKPHICHACNQAFPLELPLKRHQCSCITPKVDTEASTARPITSFTAAQASALGIKLFEEGLHRVDGAVNCPTCGWEYTEKDLVTHLKAVHGITIELEVAQSLGEEQKKAGDPSVGLRKVEWELDIRRRNGLDEVKILTARPWDNRGFGIPDMAACCWRFAFGNPEDLEQHVFTEHGRRLSVLEVGDAMTKGANTRGSPRLQDPRKRTAARSPRLERIEEDRATRSRDYRAGIQKYFKRVFADRREGLTRKSGRNAYAAQRALSKQVRFAEVVEAVAGGDCPRADTQAWIPRFPGAEARDRMVDAARAAATAEIESGALQHNGGISIDEATAAFSSLSLVKRKRARVGQTPLPGRPPGTAVHGSGGAGETRVAEIEPVMEETDKMDV